MISMPAAGCQDYSKPWLKFRTFMVRTHQVMTFFVAPHSLWLCRDDARLLFMAWISQQADDWQLKLQLMNGHSCWSAYNTLNTPGSIRRQVSWASYRWTAWPGSSTGSSKPGIAGARFCRPTPERWAQFSDQGWSRNQKSQQHDLSLEAAPQ